MILVFPNITTWAMRSYKSILFALRFYSKLLLYFHSKAYNNGPVIKYGLHLSWHKGKMYNDKSANTSTTTLPVLIMVTNVFLMTDPRLSPKCQT